MCTIKIRFRVSSVKAREGTLYYQVIHLRQVRQVYTSHHVMADEWDEDAQSFVNTGKSDLARAAFLKSIEADLRRDMAKFNLVISKLNRAGKDYTVVDVINLFNKSEVVIGVVSFMHKLIEDMLKFGQDKRAKKYQISLNSLLRFTDNKEVVWADFTPTFVAGYERFLLKRGLKRNSTSYYMRNLRSVIKRAEEHDYEIPRNCFKRVYMGVDKTVKRALPIEVVGRIRDINLETKPHLEFARSIFMFSFYTRGMSFVDIAYLRKADVSGGMITYFRRKTKQLIQVKIEPQTRKVIDSLGESRSSYLLPIITDDNADDETQYDNVYHRVNRNLQKIGKMLELEDKLTLYVARHAWASIAHHNDIPLSTISKAMGHNSETTTQIYLKSIDTSLVDDANKRIMGLMDGDGVASL